MNNKIIAGVVIGVVLIGGGALYFKKGASMGLPGSGSPAFTSIQDALSKSVSLECNFTDETGRQTKSYIKNGAMRADFTASKPEESGSMIFKEKTMYFWGTNNQGYMMTIPEETAQQKEIAKNVPTENEGLGNYKDMLSAIDKYKDSCKPSVVSDSLFTPPTSVEFTDFSKMMEGLQGIPGATGAGTGGNPAVIDQDQINKMMQQYGVPASEDENQ